MDFRLTDLPIDPASILRTLGDTRAGACVTFEGRVRGQNDGKGVESLDYEAHALLATKEGGRILAEAKDKFELLDAVCVHRTGSLSLGDIAVWIAVIAAHRGAAFEACRYVIDESKARVPIWKKEHYSDGSTEWINCATRGPESPGPG
jgi:molybdopterin synthase catalytic subunit